MGMIFYCLEAVVVVLSPEKIMFICLRSTSHLCRGMRKVHVVFYPTLMSLSVRLDEARTELGNRPFDLGDWTRFRLLFLCFIGMSQYAFGMELSIRLACEVWSFGTVCTVQCRQYQKTILHTLV